jgi:hypothetical protein
MSEDGEEQEVGAEAIVVPINYKDRTSRERLKTSVQIKIRQKKLQKL